MLVKNYDEKSFSWVTLYKVAMKYGYPANNIFSIYVHENIYNTSRKAIYVRRCQHRTSRHRSVVIDYLHNFRSRSPTSSKKYTRGNTII